MIVIRGKAHSGKGRVLLDEISKIIGKGKMWIIDMQHVPQMFSHLSCLYTQVNDLKNAENTLDALKIFPEPIDYVILYLNCSEDKIKHFECLSYLYQVEFILTVQEHADSLNEEVIIQVI